MCANIPWRLIINAVEYTGYYRILLEVPLEREYGAWLEQKGDQSEWERGFTMSW
jgi:hypothetical protein